MVKRYMVYMTEEQFRDWVDHLTYPPNVQDIKKPSKKEYNPPGEDNNHPTVKPITLIQWLVKLLSDEGDTVLDCFNGSGTTAVACKNLNRNYIGIEINQEYIDLTHKRLNGVDD